MSVGEIWGSKSFFLFPGKCHQSVTVIYQYVVEDTRDKFILVRELKLILWYTGQTCLKERILKCTFYSLEMLLETELMSVKKQKWWQKNNFLKSKTRTSHIFVTVNMQDKHSLLSSDSRLESIFVLAKGKCVRRLRRPQGLELGSASAGRVPSGGGVCLPHRSWGCRRGTPGRPALQQLCLIWEKQPLGSSVFPSGEASGLPLSQGFWAIKRVDVGPQELLALPAGGTVGAAPVLVPDPDLSPSPVTHGHVSSVIFSFLAQEPGGHNLTIAWGPVGTVCARLYVTGCSEGTEGGSVPAAHALPPAQRHLPRGARTREARGPPS